MSEVKERNQQRRDGTEGQDHWKQGGRDGLDHFTLFIVGSYHSLQGRCDQ